MLKNIECLKSRSRSFANDCILLRLNIILKFSNESAQTSIKTLIELKTCIDYHFLIKISKISEFEKNKKNHLSPLATDLCYNKKKI